MSIQSWSWIFFIIYASGMLALGFWASSRVKRADDYAVARQAWGRITCARAFAATGAAGATCLGLPGLA
mgnify:CR=1 FL=1